MFNVLNLTVWDCQVVLDGLVSGICVMHCVFISEQLLVRC